MLFLRLLQLYLSCKTTIDIYDTLVSRMVKQGMTDIAEITKAVICQIGAEMPAKLFLAMYSVDAHMQEMQKNT